MTHYHVRLSIPVSEQHHRDTLRKIAEASLDLCFQGAAELKDWLQRQNLHVRMHAEVRATANGMAVVKDGHKLMEFTPID